MEFHNVLEINYANLSLRKYDYLKKNKRVRTGMPKKKNCSKYEQIMM